ncbi:hypothetical protein [Dyella flagellata]|uniref:hypothetical protein n=1 Tax=Dyella flagellata TaxID=1867833 RepID=UPI0024E09800|nr:hypothetical protein [Dyella flagellata]
MPTSYLLGFIALTVLLNAPNYVLNAYGAFRATALFVRPLRMITSEADSRRELRGMRNGVGSIEKSATSFAMSIIVVGVPMSANGLKKPLETLLLCMAWLLEKQTGIDLQDALFMVDSIRWSILHQMRVIKYWFTMSLARMGELNFDFVSNRRVIVTTQHQRRPHDLL